MKTFTFKGVDFRRIRFILIFDLLRMIAEMRSEYVSATIKLNFNPVFGDLIPFLSLLFERFPRGNLLDITLYSDWFLTKPPKQPKSKKGKKGDIKDILGALSSDCHQSLLADLPSEKPITCDLSFSLADHFLSSLLKNLTQPVWASIVHQLSIQISDGSCHPNSDHDFRKDQFEGDMDGVKIPFIMESTAKISPEAFIRALTKALKRATA